MDEIILKENIEIDEFLDIIESVGFKTYSKEQVKKALNNTMYMVKAIVNNQVVGIGRVVGDFSIVCCLSDICVKPEYQGKGIGLKIVNRLKEMVESGVKKGEKTVTTAVLQGEEIPEATVSYCGEEKINAGKVTSNYRITATTVTVLEGEKPVWEHTLYTSHYSWAQQGSDRLPRTTVKEVDLDEYNIYWGGCPVQPGKEYTYKVTALLSNGQTYEVAKFPFKA